MMAGLRLRLTRFIGAVGEVNVLGSTMVGAATTQYTISDLQPNTPYGVSILAQNSIGKGERSVTQTVTTLSTNPPSPAMVTVTAGNKLLNVTWEAPEDIGDEELSGYRIYWSGGAISSNSGTELLPIESQSYPISGLTNGVAYQVTVEALNSAGTSRATATGTPKVNLIRSCLGMLRRVIEPLV